MSAVPASQSPDHPIARSPDRPNAPAPFDQRQRYEVVGALAQQLPGPCRVLDVGGFYRDLDGEPVLPIERFVPAARTVTVDLERARLPRYALADGRTLPFADRSFDIVSCLDVLEHVPRDGRCALIDELLRVAAAYVVIGVPVGDDGAAPREKVLQAFIRDHLGGEQQQLKEHEQFLLPRDAELRAALPKGTRSFGYGNLDRWAALMFAKHYLLGVPHNLTAFYQLDQRFDALDPAVDRRPPFYRRFYLAACAGAPLEPLDAVAGRYAQADGASPGAHDEALGYVFDVLLAHDPERLAAERQPLERRIEGLEQVVNDSQTHIRNLDTHIRALEAAAEALRERVLALEPYEREVPELRQAVAELRQVLHQVEQSRVYKLYRFSQRFSGQAR